MAMDPSIASQLSADVVAVGSSVKDSTALVGATSNAGGSVTLFVYDNGECSTANSGLVATFGPTPVVDGAVSTAPAWAATSPGTYFVVAAYSGDTNNAKAVTGCAKEPVTVTSGASLPSPTPPSPTKPPPTKPPPTKPLPPTAPPPIPPPPTTSPPPSLPPPVTVTPTAPSITTQLSTSTVVIGASVHDGSTLSGATAGAGGTVTYDVYSNDTCNASGLVASLAPVTVSGAIVPTSPNWTATTTGTFYFVADYGGDAQNAAAQSGCAAEAVTVTPTAPSITTQLSTSTVVVGGLVDVNATLTGATAGAGGTVTYDVYSNDTCSGTPYVLGTVGVTNGFTSGPLSQFVVASLGIYYYVADYSGDAQNAAAQSGCADAPLTVV
jgi:hypothetical protein